MARVTKKKETKKEMETAQAVKPLTRAEKKTATQTLIKDVLLKNTRKHNDLIDEVAKAYAEKFGGEETENINDVKGRVGSVLDIMKKESDVAYEGGMYALKARALPEAPVENVTEKAPKKTAKKTTKKTAAEKAVKEETAEKAEEKPAKKTTKKTDKQVEKQVKTTKKEPLPPAPIQPIAPVIPVTPEVAPEPIPEEKPAPKKRGRKAKAVETPATELDEVKTVVKAEENKETPVEKAVETPVAVPAITPETAPAETPVVTPIPTMEKKAETGLVVKKEAPIAKKEVIDVSFFLGGKTPAKETAKPVEKAEKQPEKAEKKVEIKEEKPVAPAPKTEKKAEAKAEKKPEVKPVQKVQPQNVRKLSEKGLRGVERPVQKPQTADERLCEAFLKRIRSLGGDYFEYYSIYLLERYSMKNGRRLEGLRISGGDHDGGIDGEIELTDKMGFKETIYIQSKNWNPEKGDEKLWVVGETLLQQFIGACACRQARDGKQNCRGIFVTTSRFTPEAKRILDAMSDKIVGYDGNDLYEAAKECSFGVIQKNGAWVLDEKLLSGSKAFFNLY